MPDSPSAVRKPPSGNQPAGPPLFERFRRWWQSARPQPSGVPVPFAILCRCGQTLQGPRKSRHQVLACPACKRPLFVLARSPLPLPGAPSAEKPAPAAKRGKSSARRFRWRMPALAAALTLAGVVGLFLALWPRLIREPSEQRERASATGVSERIEAGRRALADSNFRLAQRLFGEARARADGEAGLLSRDESRRLVQLQRQSELLALLLDDSLQEIVHRGALHRQEEEWQAKFASDYRGRSVIFDDDVGLEEGRPVLRFYAVRVGDETVRLALEDLKLLRELQADLPRRLVFGARLANVAREAGGRWVVCFEPDSGVLFTDDGAVAACLPGQPDTGLREVLRWQRDWVLAR